MMDRYHLGTFAAMRSCLLGAILITCATLGCNTAGSTASLSGEKKIGVLLVSHGSHSEQWRGMLQDIEETVREDILKEGDVSGIKSAFMEYTEPSIATQLKAFDEEGYSDVILVPVLLTVSSHSFDDIPVIAGQKTDKQTIAALELENIEIYHPQADITISPLLDFPKVLEENVIRRIGELSTDSTKEGVVLVGYGSEPYDEEWCEMLDSIIEVAIEKTGIEQFEYCWCGHIAAYKTEPTEESLQLILDKKERALVVPLLVAIDETFQGQIIGGAIRNTQERLPSSDSRDRIGYLGDAILPDENINQWVIDISSEIASQIKDPQAG